jgi:hypothetical protein
LGPLPEQRDDLLIGARRTAAQAGDRKLTAPVTLFAAIEAEQHEALWAVAFAQRRSADIRRPIAVKP